MGNPRRGSPTGMGNPRRGSPTGMLQPPIALISILRPAGCAARNSE